MRENCTYGSVRGSRQAFHFLYLRKECRDCLLDGNIMMRELNNNLAKVQDIRKKERRNTKRFTNAVIDNTIRTEQTRRNVVYVMGLPVYLG